MLTRSITIIYTIQWSSVGGSTRRDEGVVYVIIKRLLRVSNAVPTVNMEKLKLGTSSNFHRANIVVWRYTWSTTNWDQSHVTNTTNTNIREHDQVRWRLGEQSSLNDKNSEQSGVQLVRNRLLNGVVTLQKGIWLLNSFEHIKYILFD